MKTNFIVIFFLIGTGVLFSQENIVKEPERELIEKATNFNLFESSVLKLDLKLIDPNKGSFGIDYNLSLDKPLFEKEQKSIDLYLKSNGFVTVTGENPAQNSMINEISISANGYPIGEIGKSEVWWRTPWWEINEKDIIQMSRERAALVSSPFWMFFDLHAKHETTQDFSNFDYTLGGKLAITTSFLTSIIDFPFGLLRTKPNNRPRQIDLSVGYDYVFGLENTMDAELRAGENNTNRFNFVLDWETGIFESQRISFYYSGYYEPAAPEMIKLENKDFNHFYQIKLDHILSSSNSTTSKVSIKYTEGELPPNFVRGTVIGGGFSVEF